MPQHARRVLEHAHEDGDLRGLVLDRGPCVAFLHGEELAKLAETGEAPVALLCDEAMMCVWREMRVSDAVSDMYIRTGDGVNGGVGGVGDDEGELCAGVPFLRPFGFAVVEVDGYGVVWWCVRVSEGKEQDSPWCDSLVRQCGDISKRASPFVTAALELWAVQFLVERFPLCERPAEDLELLDVLAQIRHVLGRKRIV